MRFSSLFRAACLLTALVVVVPAEAQIPSSLSTGGDRISARGFYKFSQPGDAIVQVIAVGSIPAQGIYELTAGTSLADLIALSGGAVPDRRGEATVRLHREGAATLEVDARSLFEENRQPIALREGDVVEVVGLVSTVPGFYTHTEPGNESIQLTVAGAFAAPGRYIVDTGTTIGEIVALAGGLGGRGQRAEDTEIESTVRLFRDGALAFEAPLEELYARQTQTLQEGDVVDLDVVVEQRGPLLTTILSVASTTASILVLLFRFGVF